MKKCVVFGICIVCVLLICAGLRMAFIYFNLPYFSVITSVYNYDKYIGKTIRSVLASDYPRFELIVVNDGSTDRSPEIIERYAKKDKRIKVINQENQGLSVARNNAMKIAKGDYFWFVDADDYINSKAFSKLAEHIQKTKRPDFVSFYIQPVNAKGYKMKQDGYSKLPSILDKYQDKTFTVADIPFKDLFSYPVTSGKQVYSKAFLQKYNIWFVPKLVFEDDCFFLTTLEAGARGTIIPDFLYYKRAHNKSIVAHKSIYYDSTALLPIKVYESVKRVGASEERARMYWQLYFSGVFEKFPRRKKDLIPLEKLLLYINEKPQNEFWNKQYEQLSEFYEEKKNSPLREAD